MQGSRCSPMSDKRLGLNLPRIYGTLVLRRNHMLSYIKRAICKAAMATAVMLNIVVEYVNLVVLDNPDRV